MANNNQQINANSIIKNGKELKLGYTTGSCATAAAVGALRLLLTNQKQESVAIILPSGKRVEFILHDCRLLADEAVCSVIKDAGDDPDVTHGMKIFVAVKLNDMSEDIFITGGDGIGVVTAKGLQVQVGEYAINPVPREMIKKNITFVKEQLCYNKGIDVKIYAPLGKEIAKKTYNERLGIIGGISILGTTGIVEPMSEQALIDTIRLVIDKRAFESRNVLIAPGNYGRDYCINKLGVDIDTAVKCSNYIGETLDYIAYKGFDKVLIVGHVGKLVKLAGGIMNTHSSYADCRTELIALYALLSGADNNTAENILLCITTDGAIEILQDIGLTEAVFNKIIGRIKYHLDYRLRNTGVTAEVMLFSDNKILAYSDKAYEYAGLFK